MVKKVTKKKSNSKETKNIVSIVLGAVSILISLFFPYFSGLIASAGIILAYLEKGKSSIKLNKWAITLNIIGVVLSVVILSFVAIAFAQVIQANSLL